MAYFRIGHNTPETENRQAYHHGKDHRAMKMRTKMLVLASLPFLIFFAFGVTEFGQTVLIGKLPANVDHWKAEDVYMGAGLAPWSMA